MYHSEGEYRMKKATTIKNLINVFDIRPIENEFNMEEFYVDTSEARGEDSAEKLMLILEQSDRRNKKFLFGGHNGCGKSTELYKVSENLKDRYLVVKYSIGQYMDFLSASYVDIVFSILRSIVVASQENDISINKNIISSIFNYWNEEKVVSFTDEEILEGSAESSVGGSVLNILSAKIKLFLQSSSKVKEEIVQRLNPSIPRLIEMVNEFLDNFQKELGEKQLLLIIDDLDKLSLQQAKQIFIENSKNITALHANVIYTFPIYLYYSPEFRCIQSDFEAPILLSMIKVKTQEGYEYTKGVDTLTEIIKKRADDSLFEKGVIKFVIKKSGGCIRTAFRILREAALKSELYYKKQINVKDEDEIVTLENTKLAYRAYKSEMERVIRKDQIDLLIEIHKNKRPVIDEDNILVMNLLMSLAVIEYNGERWCDLNPAIEDYLIDLDILKKDGMSTK